MPAPSEADDAVREHSFQLEVPEGAWCSLASVPGERLALQVVAMSRLADGRVVEDVEILGPGWRLAVARIGAHPRVSSVKVLRKEEDRSMLRVVHAGCAVIDAVASTAVLPRFPLRLQSGEEQCLLYATAAEAETFVRAVAASGARVRVHGVRLPVRRAGLTARQREVLEAARRAGYYDAPRRVSLTELAEVLGIAKSTLSELLVHIESRIIRGVDENPMVGREGA